MENVNNKITKELKARVEKTKPLVDLINKEYNEFFDYWMVCYTADSFKALDLFYPYLRGAELIFSPSELYNKAYGLGDSNEHMYEKRGANCFNKIPKKFSDGPMFLGLSHQETYGRDALFIPTKCISSFNQGLYKTLKEFTPKAVKHCKYFPDAYFNEDIMVQPMRPEVTHAVVLWESTENGDQDIKVRWIHESWNNFSEFISMSTVFDHLWEGVDESTVRGSW